MFDVKAFVLQFAICLRKHNRLIYSGQIQFNYFFGPSFVYSMLHSCQNGGRFENIDAPSSVTLAMIPIRSLFETSSQAASQLILMYLISGFSLVVVPLILSVVLRLLVVYFLALIIS